jgi:glutathione S-transferase
MKLWHCKTARSLRPLWALEEMGMSYELEVMQFPPRIFNKEYLGTNVLGTVPYFEDGTTRMTESSGICHYLVERYQRYDFGLKPDHPEYGDYLNWLYHSDATLTFPQTIAMRYIHLEPTPEKLPVAKDYAKWFYARLRMLDNHLVEREYLCDNRFTIADIAVGYALYLGNSLKLGEFAEREFTPQLKDYLARLMERPAFKAADAMDGGHPAPM